jgi:hypothetical protein
MSTRGLTATVTATPPHTEPTRPTLTPRIAEPGPTNRRPGQNRQRLARTDKEELTPSPSSTAVHAPVRLSRSHRNASQEGHATLNELS